MKFCVLIILESLEAQAEGKPNVKQTGTNRVFHAKYCEQSVWCRQVLQLTAQNTGSSMVQPHKRACSSMEQRPAFVMPSRRNYDTLSADEQRGAKDKQSVRDCACCCVL